MAQGLSTSLRGTGIALLGNIADIATLCRDILCRRYGAARCMEAAMLNRALISIVDDDQSFRESMRQLVMLLGYTVETFPSAADFLAARLLPETACLVADVQMPGMTGIELHRQLIDAGYAIPTILVTAYPDEAIRDQALRDGVVCFLSKPVDDHHLERCLRSALQPGTPIEDNS